MTEKTIEKLPAKRCPVCGSGIGVCLPTQLVLPGIVVDLDTTPAPFRQANAADGTEE